MVLIAICNPVSGYRRASSFFNEHVLPLLAAHSLRIDNVFATEYPGHAGKIVRDFITTKHGKDKIQIILCSGDGLIHEIVNDLPSSASNPASGVANTIEFILLPCGTANALYSSFFPPHSQQPKKYPYELQSLYKYLRSSDTRPLTVAVNIMIPSVPIIEVLSTVVTSTCLHASILRDSEVLREEFPGLDRFKIAAQRNCDRWYYAHAKIFPSSDGEPVKVFEPSLKRFVSHPETKQGAVVEMEGPFVYFLSTVNVDRLEPTYVITPSVEPASAGFCDLVIIRPSRDPTYRADDETGRSTFIAKLWEILNAPNKDGEHIHLRYGEDGKITTEGEGPPVVEYLRCGKWEWHPEETDERAHCVCSDGAIYQIPKGGKLASSITSTRNRTKFVLYA
ncbi:hypothetical protein AX15_006109 [Amanita polypyramis BW_CC]|nr:hypothetical protein AX15_006109 [Amanita polypyramis BW_CC]